MSQDREFEKYLDGKSELSRLYADLPEAVLPQVDVPKHLDAAILAEAHRAVSSRPGAKPKRRWAIPLGMVATLLVAVMIGLQLPYMLNDAALPQQQKEEKVAVATMDNNIAERTSAAQEERKKSQDSAREMSMPKPEISRRAPAPMEAEVAATTTATQNAPVLVLPPAAVAAKRMELRERADVDSGMVLSKEKSAVGHAEGKLSDSIEQRVPAAATLAIPAPVQSERSMKDEAGDTNLPPADWLARIKRLKQEEKLEEARKELAKFKKRYPDYPVPASFELR